jgi:hypothetical protein
MWLLVRVHIRDERWQEDVFGTHLKSERFTQT